jgi:hypothetical protein
MSKILTAKEWAKEAYDDEIPDDIANGLEGYAEYVLSMQDKPTKDMEADAFTKYPYNAQLCQNPDGSRGEMDANKELREAYLKGRTDESKVNK